MATYPNQRINFIPVTSIPSSLQAANPVRIATMKEIEVFIRFTADMATTGEYVLLKWLEEPQEWWPYRNAQTFDTSKYLGKSMAAWNQDIDSASYYQVLVPNNVTANIAYMQGVRYA